MREVNITIAYLMKISEIMFLLILCVTMTQNYFTMSSNMTGEGIGVKLPSLACILLSWYHLAHNNFLNNLRLKLFTSDSKYECIWKIVNTCICKFGYSDQANGC